MTQSEHHKRQAADNTPQTHNNVQLSLSSNREEKHLTPQLKARWQYFKMMKEESIKPGHLRRQVPK